MTKKKRAREIWKRAVAKWQFEVKAYDESEVEEKWFDGNYKELNKGLPIDIIDEQVEEFLEKKVRKAERDF